MNPFLRKLTESPAFWRCWGVVMAVFALRLPWWSQAPRFGEIALLVVVPAVAIVLSPPQLRRPVLMNWRLPHRIDMHRNTLFSAGFVSLIALEKATAVQAGIDAVLLAGYLLLLDVAVLPTRVRQRTASPGFLIALAVTVGAATALLALPASTSLTPRLIAAVVALITVGVVIATAFTVSFSRRVSSARPETPESEHAR